MSIEDWRSQIDEVDRKLVELFSERARFAIEIAKIKQETGLAVFDPERERQVCLNIQQANHGPLDNDSLKRLFETIIDECRRIERQTTHSDG